MVVGSQSTCSNNELVIEQEGHTKKFVEQVKNLDFNAAYSVKIRTRSLLCY